MIETLSEQLASLGVAGLLFVMWWFERQERTRGARTQDALRRDGEELRGMHAQLLEVVRTNTAALAALREELRSQRETDGEWFRCFAEQLGELSAK